MAVIRSGLLSWRGGQVVSCVVQLARSAVHFIINNYCNSKVFQLQAGNSRLTRFIINITMQDNHTAADILQQVSMPMPFSLQQKVIRHLSQEIASRTYHDSPQQCILALLIQKVTPKQQNKCLSLQTQVNISILLAHAMREAMDVPNNEHAYLTFQRILFDVGLPLRLKMEMHERVARWLQHCTDNNMGDLVQSKVKNMIEQAMRQANTNRRDKADVCRLALIIIEKLAEHAVYNAQLEQVWRVADLLVCFRTLLSRIDLSDKQLCLYAEWLQIYSNLLKNLSDNLSQKDYNCSSLSNRIEASINKSQLYSLGETVLKFKAVCHQEEQTAMFCPQSIAHFESNKILQLRILYFQLLVSTYDIAQHLDSLSFFACHEQIQMLEWAMIGIHCYIKQDQHVPTTIVLIQLCQAKYRLQAALLSLYYHITKKHYHNLQNLIDKGLNLNQNMIISLLQLSKYELYLFDNDTEHFLDIVEDFSSGRAQLASPKAMLSHIIASIIKVVPNFKLQFILMAKFQLQRATHCFISGYYDGSQSPLSTMSTQASLLMLCLFSSDLQNLKEMQYLRNLFKVQNLTKLSDVCLVLFFELAIAVNCDIITNQKESYNAFDLALWSKKIPVRMASLRCMEHLCQKYYNPRHLVDLVQLIVQNREDFYTRELSLMWSIVKITAACHVNEMQVQTLNWLIVTLKKLVMKQLFYQSSMLSSKFIHISIAINAVGICGILLQNMASLNLSRFVMKTSVQIAMLYRFVQIVQIKEQILCLVKIIYNVAKTDKVDFPNELLQIVPLLVRDLSTQQDYHILSVLQTIVVALGRKRRPKLLRKIKHILITISHLFSLQIQKLQQSLAEANETLLYGYLVILNRLVQYFGAEIKSQNLYGWVLNCRKIQQQAKLANLQQRISNFIFSCSLYLPQTAMFATLGQSVSRQRITIFEKEMMLDTLSIFFSSRLTVGGVGKYVYLIKLLYLLTTQSIQFEQDKPQQKIAATQYFTHKSRNKMEYQQYCLKVYLLFKTHKYSIYSYLNAYIQPAIMRQFQNRQVLLRGCELLARDTYIDYRAPNCQLDPLLQYKLQQCNPFGSCQSFRESYNISSLIVDVEQYRQTHIMDMCRKLIKQT